ncbi:MAG: GGDEF domain-containing protein [Fibrobacter sp.]|nr:GGDEF domain-containing protein [Fibrobacter sp.]
MGSEYYDNHFSYFLDNNEKRMNGIFCRILWYCCLVSPTIALGVLFAAFPGVTYWACLQSFLVIFVFAIGHSVLYKFKPESSIIKYIGLVGALVTIYVMSIGHMDISLSYFFVPMTSLLYCKRRTFVTMSILSYLMMLVSNWQISEFEASALANPDAVEWFVTHIDGMTIEFVVMFVSGFFINKAMVKHLKTMYSNEVNINKSEHSAYTDQLTGLWNRRYMERAFDKFMVVQHNSGAMLVVDMDHMKVVNDSYGHLEGDRALKLFASILQKTFDKSESVTICRFGGDEFVVLLPNVKSMADLTLCISHLISNSDEAFCNDEKLNVINISIGAAFANDLDMNYQALFDRADKALYDVKKSGRNSYQIYTEM